MVSEIHTYPLRPEGYAEPLFHTPKSRGQILEHLARSSWLSRASEAPQSKLPGPGNERQGEADGQAGNEQRVIASWREVDRWWEPEGGVDVVWRLLEDRRGGQRIRAKHTSSSR